MGIGAIMGTARFGLFAFLRVAVPVVEAVLLVGVDVALFFFAAAGYGKSSDKNQGNVEGASAAHEFTPVKIVFGQNEDV